jgi:hypothetical protein
VKDLPQRRFEPVPKRLQGHDGSDFEVPGMFEVPDLFEAADLAVGPCVTFAILSKQTGLSQGGPFTARDFHRVSFRSVHEGDGETTRFGSRANGPA